MRNPFTVRKITEAAVLTALALIISWLERPLMALLPLPLPGFKLGLANIVTLFALYRLGPRESAVILLLRIALGSALFGSPVTLALSLSGGILALSASVLLYKRESVSVPGVSAAASACHMTGQIAAAALILQTPGLLLSYLPYLLILSLPTGLLTGEIAGILIRRAKFRIR